MRVYFIRNRIRVFLSIYISRVLLLSMARDFYNVNSITLCRGQRADTGTRTLDSSSIIVAHAH